MAADWATKLGAATTKISAGIDSVTVAPGQAAARQKAVWLQNTTAAADKFAAHVAAVPLADWQAAFKNKGIPRIATGATNAVPKMTNFLTQFLPYVDNVKRNLPPRGNLDQNIARVVAQIRGNAAFKMTRAGR